MNKIERFLERKAKRLKNTDANYGSGIRQFFKILGINTDSYFHGRRDYQADIDKYYKKLWKDGNSSATIRTRISIIKTFLRYYDRSTKDLEIWDDISQELKGEGNTMEETALTKKDIKKILEFGDTCSRALVLTMGSCGCRIDEALNFKIYNIYFDECPVRIFFPKDIVKGKKKSRNSFITPEAVSAIKAWLKVRDDWLKTASRRGVGLGKKKSTTDNRIFPMSPQNARAKWKTMVEKAGYNSYTKMADGKKRLKAHLHSLRAFFRSNFGNADLAETLMGHSGYLSTYKRYDYHQLAEEYQKYKGNVSIFESTDLSETNKRLSNLQRENDSLKKVLAEIVEELNKLPEIKAVPIDPGLGKIAHPEKG